MQWRQAYLGGATHPPLTLGPLCVKQAAGEGGRSVERVQRGQFRQFRGFSSEGSVQRVQFRQSTDRQQHNACVVAHMAFAGVFVYVGRAGSEAESEVGDSGQTA